MSAECKRLSPDHTGPSCGCGDAVCTLDLPASDVLWRCDGCGFEQITPQDDPPANCQRCRHSSVFWVRGGVSPSGADEPGETP